MQIDTLIEDCRDSIYHKLAETVEQSKADEHKRKGEHPVGLGPSLYPGADVVFCQIPGKASSVISRQLQRERHDLRPSGTFKKSLRAGCRTHIKPRREESSFLGVQEKGFAFTRPMSE